MLFNNKKDTLYLDKYKYETINDLLNEILKRLEIFNKFNGYVPNNIQMTVKQYYDIRNYNPSLFKGKEKEFYILCMKVLV